MALKYVFGGIFTSLKIMLIIPTKKGHVFSHVFSQVSSHMSFHVSSHMSFHVSKHVSRRAKKTSPIIIKKKWRSLCQKAKWESPWDNKKIKKKKNWITLFGPSELTPIEFEITNPRFEIFKTNAHTHSAKVVKLSKNV